MNLGFCGALCRKHKCVKVAPMSKQALPSPEEIQAIYARGEEAVIRLVTRLVAQLGQWTVRVQ